MNAMLPKQIFLEKHKDIARELATITQSSNFQTALALALSQFVIQSTPSCEQIQAVRTFIHTLLNLAFQDEALPAYPQRGLDHAAYNLPLEKIQAPKAK